MPSRLSAVSALLLVLGLTASLLSITTSGAAAQVRDPFDFGNRPWIGIDQRDHSVVGFDFGPGPVTVTLSGGDIMEHTKVSGWRLGSGRIESVVTDRGEYTGANYIVTAGAWSREALGVHALKLNIHPVRGQMLLFKVMPGQLHSVVLQNDFYLIPRQDGYILAGSTMEEAGFDKTITEDARKTLLDRAHALLSSLTEETLVSHWSGLRPGSQDNIPVISRHPAIDNLYLNSGHHRYGVTMVLGSAHIISNMVMNNSQPFDVAPYQWPV